MSRSSLSLGMDVSDPNRHAELDSHQAEIPSNQALHVLDLPALYTKPDASVLLSTLSRLTVKPSSFHTSVGVGQDDRDSAIDESGLPRYLTSIISSPLHWIVDDEVKEQIWEVASKRLAERSGRNAAPSFERQFRLPPLPVSDAVGRSQSQQADRIISIHEPSLTADNLGHKTWSSSYILSLHLPSLAQRLPAATSESPKKVLELGAGTGLFGISFAATFPHHEVHLTDLAEIVPNLERNVALNRPLAQRIGSTIEASELDWDSTPPLPFSDSTSSLGQTPETATYDVILAADPIYSPLHPTLLTRAVYTKLAYSDNAVFILGLPIREAYIPQIDELWVLLRGIGLKAVEQGEQNCVDDWVDARGIQVDVTVRWAVWKWRDGKDKTLRR